MATVGRGRAVAVISGRTFDGALAWVLWAIVHVWSLIEFRSRAAVMLQWAWAYLSRQRTARLITGDDRDTAMIRHSDGRRPVPGDGLADGQDRLVAVPTRDTKGDVHA